MHLYDCKTETTHIELKLNLKTAVLDKKKMVHNIPAAIEFFSQYLYSLYAHDIVSAGDVLCIIVGTQYVWPRKINFYLFYQFSTSKIDFRLA